MLLRRSGELSRSPKGAEVWLSRLCGDAKNAGSPFAEDSAEVLGQRAAVDAQISPGRLRGSR